MFIKQFHITFLKGLHRIYCSLHRSSYIWLWFLVIYKHGYPWFSKNLPYLQKCSLLTLWEIAPKKCNSDKWMFSENIYKHEEILIT